MHYLYEQTNSFYWGFCLLWALCSAFCMSIFDKIFFLCILIIQLARARTVVLQNCISKLYVSLQLTSRCHGASLILSFRFNVCPNSWQEMSIGTWNIWSSDLLWIKCPKIIVFFCSTLSNDKIGHSSMSSSIQKSKTTDDLRQLDKKLVFHLLMKFSFLFLITFLFSKNTLSIEVPFFIF